MTFWLRLSTPSIYFKITSEAFSSLRTGGKPVGAATVGLACWLSPEDVGIPQGFQKAVAVAAFLKVINIYIM